MATLLHCSLLWNQTKMQLRLSERATWAGGFRWATEASQLLAFGFPLVDRRQSAHAGCVHVLHVAPKKNRTYSPLCQALTAIRSFLFAQTPQTASLKLVVVFLFFSFLFCKYLISSPFPFWAMILSQPQHTNWEEDFKRRMMINSSVFNAVCPGESDHRYMRSKTKSLLRIEMCICL